MTLAAHHGETARRLNGRATAAIGKIQAYTARGDDHVEQGYNKGCRAFAAKCRRQPDQRAGNAAECDRRGAIENAIDQRRARDRFRDPLQPGGRDHPVLPHM